MAITLDGTNGITTPTYGGTDTSEYVVPVTAFKNRIINGAMVIDQRNAGASVNLNNVGAYTLDRWQCFGSGATVRATVQQNAGSVTPPSGYTNYLGVTSSGAYSIPAGEYFVVYQKIEGFNFADMAWGTASAQSVTLSFWVRSSLTGTFGGSVQNSAQNRNYNFSFVINAANTWEQKTITIAGDTTGTWLTNNGIGAQIFFSVGAGSSAVGSAGSWGGTALFGVTGQINLVATNGATFYITGVQLEKGTTATSFDYRPYGTELALCQRYFFSVNAIATSGQTVSTTKAIFSIRPPVSMRASPTCTYANQNRITYPTVIDYSGVYTGATRNLSSDSIGFEYNQSSGSTFTQNVPVTLNDTGASCVITGSAEL